MSPRKHKLWLAAGFGLLCMVLATTAAHADVRRVGTWPTETDETICLTFEGTRSKALRALAAAAGWSIIDNPGSATFAGAGDTVNVFVTDQPAAKVLEMLLSDGDYVVKRDGKLLSISVHASGGPKPAESSLPLPPPFKLDPDDKPATAPDKNDPAPRPNLRDAQDRTVLGSSVVLGPKEVVNNLTVLGGSAAVRGTVQEDVLVLGGSVKIQEGAHVYGDVGVLGGAVELESGCRVDGDVSSAGGHIQRAAGAIVKGEETAIASGKTDGTKHGRHADDDDDDDAKPAKDEGWSFSSVINKLGSALSRAALLYAFGCVLLATAGKPMERMQQELAERPMRSLGLGLASFIGAFFALIVLCVTIIGIPVAIMLVLVGVLGVYAGMCALFVELGALVLEERTPSPYVHLALGCLMYLIFSTLPFIGWIATTLAVVCGLGLIVSTRFAGLLGRVQSQLTTPAST